MSLIDNTIIGHLVKRGTDPTTTHFSISTEETEQRNNAGISKTRGRKRSSDHSLVMIPPAGVQTPVCEFTAVLDVKRKHDTVNI